MLVEDAWWNTSHVCSNNTRASNIKRCFPQRVSYYFTSTSMSIDSALTSRGRCTCSADKVRRITTFTLNMELSRFPHTSTDVVRLAFTLSSAHLCCGFMTALIDFTIDCKAEVTSCALPTQIGCLSRRGNESGRREIAPCSVVGKRR